MTSTAPASPAPGSRALHVLHLLLLLGLSLIFLFVIGLIALSFSSGLRAGLSKLFSWGPSDSLFSFKFGQKFDTALLIVIALTPLLAFLPARRLGLRSWRLLLAFPLGLGLLALSWFMHDAVEALSSLKSTQSLIVAGIIGLSVATSFLLAWRLSTRSWWWVGGGYLVAAPLLVYLAIDDATLRHPVTIEEVSPAFPGAEQSYEVLMRYGKNHPLGRDFRSPQRIFKKSPFVGPDKPQAWAQWLADNRAEIEADWADLAAVRSWWTELNSFERIGDLTPSRIDAEIMAFSPPRAYSQHATMIAGLLALDGRGDEAFETLLPVLEVSRKLEPSSRTLVRTMITRVTQKMAIDTAGFVLDRTTVSAPLRARFAAALARGVGGESGARRLIGIEYAYGLSLYRELRVGDLAFGLRDSFNGPPKYFGRAGLRQMLNALTPLLYNPNKTFNLYGDLTERWQDLAARRESEKMNQATDAFFQNEARIRFKNLFGTLMLAAGSPAYSKVTESYWKIEDARIALLDRLAKM